MEENEIIILDLTNKNGVKESTYGEIYKDS